MSTHTTHLHNVKPGQLIRLNEDVLDEHGTVQGCTQVTVIEERAFELPDEIGDIVLVNGGATWVLVAAPGQRKRRMWQNVNGDRRTPEAFAEFIEHVTRVETPTLMLRLSSSRAGRGTIEELYRP